MVRHVTKSMLHFSWAMSLLGLQQVASLLTAQRPRQATHRTASAFDHMAQTAELQLGDVLKEVFRAGEQVQNGSVDLAFSFLDQERYTSSDLMQTTAALIRHTSDTVGRVIQNVS
ncbi:hypothetical protein C2W62_07225 [Candidatus Entotheonella serta]|nr:hypothetical protein C2W62_07225 [Candidatus Entotheonella serta]